MPTLGVFKSCRLFVVCLWSVISCLPPVSFVFRAIFRVTVRTVQYVHPARDYTSMTLVTSRNDHDNLGIQNHRSALRSEGDDFFAY